MNNAEMWSLIVGFVAPMVIAVLQRPTFPRQLRAVVTVAFCIVVGFVTVLVTGQLTGKTLTASILIVLVTAMVTYEHLWKATGIAPLVEKATSPPPRRPSPGPYQPGHAAVVGAKNPPPGAPGLDSPAGGG